MMTERYSKNQGTSYTEWYDKYMRTLKFHSIQSPEGFELLLANFYQKDYSIEDVIDLLQNDIVEGKITVDLKFRSGNKLSKDFFAFDSLREFLTTQEPRARFYFNRRKRPLSYS